MKPKKLNLNDIWRLYLILKPALDDRETEAVFLDEIERLITLSREGTLLECLNLLYDNRDIRKIEPSKEYIVLFMHGLIENSFYEFVDYIKVLTDGTPRKPTRRS